MTRRALDLWLQRHPHASTVIAGLILAAWVAAISIILWSA